MKQNIFLGIIAVALACVMVVAPVVMAQPVQGSNGGTGPLQGSSVDINGCLLTSSAALLSSSCDFSGGTNIITTVLKSNTGAPANTVNVHPSAGIEIDAALSGLVSLRPAVVLTFNSGTAGSGTGYTTNSTGSLQHKVHKITVARTALTAAATTEDETIWTVPAKTRLLRVIVDVTQAFDDGAGPISAVTITCGPSAGSAAYVASSSVFTVNTIGDVAAEIGTGLTSATIADIPSFSGTTGISCRFTSTGGNLSTLTTGSATFYIEHLVYP